jgi:hypothetical protein
MLRVIIFAAISVLGWLIPTKVDWRGTQQEAGGGGEESLEHREPHHPDKQHPFPEYALQTNMTIINERQKDLLLDRFSHWLRPPPSWCRDWFHRCSRYFLKGRVRKQLMFLSRWSFRLTA